MSVTLAPERRLRPGIFARTFPGDSLESRLDRVVDSGVSAIQFNFAVAGWPSLPDEVPVELAARVREAAHARGLEIVAVSGTYNMAHPDLDVRRYCRQALEAIVEAAPTLGTEVVTLCTGSRDPQDMWRAHPDNTGSAAWEDMVSAVRAAVRVAERCGVTLAIEPEHSTVVHDAGTARELLDEIASPHLKVVIDPSALMGPGELNDQAATMEHAFELLGDDLALAHVKDLLDDGAVVPIGRGRLDFDHYVSLLRAAGYDGAVVLHELAPDDVADSVAYVRSRLQGEILEVG